MDNRSLAHNWANQVKPHGKGSNFFYEGIHLYSYGHHFEAGRIVKTEKGNTIVLINGENYSPSTQRHLSYAWQASNHMEQFAFPLHNSSYSIIVRDELTKDDFTRAFIRFGNIVIDSCKKASRSRKYGDLHLNDAKKAVEDWNKLKAYFPSLTKGMKKLKLPSDIQIKKLNDKDKLERKLERERQKEREKEDSYKWLNYERNYMSRVSQTLLRQRMIKEKVHPDYIANRRFVDEVETSHGARVPLDQAKRFYGVIKRFKDNPNACKERLKVGNFHLSNLTPNGAHIGCHFIAWSEMERFANVMGW